MILIKSPPPGKGFLLYAAIGIALIICLRAIQPGPFWHRSVPNFAKIGDVGERKEAFFDFLEPYIKEANAGILSQRKRLNRMSRWIERSELGKRDQRWLHQLASSNGIKFDAEKSNQDLIEELLLRVDIVPPSMALAQAALESGWGTSRFARKGNNLFGIWCYDPGCGLVPLHRPAGATYEVASYASPKESFDAYLRILNSNPVYGSLWAMRQQSRHNGNPMLGYNLAAGLRFYSQERDLYVQKVRRMIQSNGLGEFDKR